MQGGTGASLPYVYLCPFRWTNGSFINRYAGNHYRRSFRKDASSSRIAICSDFREPRADENSVLKRVCSFVSRLMLGNRFGLFRRPAALGPLLRVALPFGSRFLAKQVCK